MAVRCCYRVRDEKNKNLWLPNRNHNVRSAKPAVPLVGASPAEAKPASAKRDPYSSAGVPNEEAGLGGASPISTSTSITPTVHVRSTYPLKVIIKHIIGSRVIINASSRDPGVECISLIAPGPEGEM